MSNIEADLLAMRTRLRKEVNEAIKEVGDVVSEVSQDYATLKPEIERDPALLNNMVADILIEDAHVPVPRWLLRWLVSKLLRRYIK